MINGVPVTIEMNKTGMIERVILGGIYIIEPSLDNWNVIFVATGDNGKYRSSNIYSQRYSYSGKSLEEIIHGLAFDAYFPNCPEYMRLREIRHQEEEKRLEAIREKNKKKYTNIYYSTKDLFGYESLFDNNVGGCESYFYGVCIFEDKMQDIPCIFCPHHH